jgi:hypothetical protein
MNLFRIADTMQTKNNSGILTTTKDKQMISLDSSDYIKTNVAYSQRKH